MEAPPPLRSSRSLEAPSHGMAHSAQQPPEFASMPRAALSSKDESCRAVLRAMYKQQFTCTGAG